MIAEWWTRDTGVWGAPEGTRAWGPPVHGSWSLDGDPPEEYDFMLAFGSSVEPPEWIRQGDKYRREAAERDAARKLWKAEQAAELQRHGGFGPMGGVR